MKRSVLKRGTKPLRRKSKNPKKTARDKAWKEFSLFIRNRDGWECITCGSTQDIQAGHYIHNRANTYWREDNVHAQCKKCNYFSSGNLAEYAIYMLDRYGERHLKELVSDSKVHKQWLKSEYDMLYNKYKDLNEVQD